ncbi:MAG: GntR family transcriptional regulator [Clostridia bacterium]|nr:GntR family transcriptional regulator [Clostridia bacterium]
MSSLMIDLKDRRPIYEQLIDQIMDMVLHGVMQPGEQLPSVRALAGELAINPNTIQKAYAELERRGITYSVPGRGSFVSAELQVVTEEHRRRILSDTRALLEEARATGMTAQDFLPLIGQVWKEDANL